MFILSRSFVFLIVLFLYSGCSLAPIYKSIDKSSYETATNFSKLTDSLIEDLSSRTSSLTYYSSDSLIITDFVNINSLDNKSTLGFILSNELKTSLSKKFPNLSVKELTLGRDIKIGSNGVKILSRKLKELKTNQAKNIKYILVGTYAITQKKLMLFLKLLDYTSGDIIASSSETTQITNEISNLAHITNETNKFEYNKKLRNIYQPMTL